MLLWPCSCSGSPPSDKQFSFLQHFLDHIDSDGPAAHWLPVDDRFSGAEIYAYRSTDDSTSYRKIFVHLHRAAWNREYRNATLAAGPNVHFEIQFRLYKYGISIWNSA